MEAVASVNKNTVVVVNSVGPIVMEAWINNANGESRSLIYRNPADPVSKVTAVVWAGLPGQEAGNSLVDVIYGAVNPSGRLPYTIGKAVTDYSAQVLYTTGTNIVQIPYTEGIFIDYRHFDAVSLVSFFVHSRGTKCFFLGCGYASL